MPELRNLAATAADGTVHSLSTRCIFFLSTWPHMLSLRILKIAFLDQVSRRLSTRSREKILPKRCIGWRTLMGLLPLLLFAPTTFAQQSATSGKPLNFVRDIQPILANHCWSCHGPDEKTREADLRLDLQQVAFDTQAIVPNKPAESGLVVRIHSTNSEEVMPPPATKKPLSAEQKKLLEQWIQEGATYEGHWAFQAIQRTQRPVQDSLRGKSAIIDAIVREELAKQGMQPAPPADRATLLRRVTLDLTGLPPTKQEIEQFMADSAPDAYHRVVNRLLNSKAYAEKMASHWLDLSRYADTNGYNNDEDRTMWPWRDWVIEAFDRNIPYDRFVTEQLAGDLLPDPTQDQLIATAFLRNQGHNTEGGIIQEEYRVEYVADRVHTTATVFLGLSMQCARCHDHKYDPISQKEYFRFFALFNNIDERQASYSKFVAAEPFIRVSTKSQQEQLSQLDQKLKELKASSAFAESAYLETLTTWLKTQSAESIEKRFGTRVLHTFPFDAVQAKTSESAGELVMGLDTQNPQHPVSVVGNLAWANGKHQDSLQLDGATHLSLGNVANFENVTPFAISVWVYLESDGSMAIASKMDEEDAYRGFDLLIENGKLVSHFIHRWPQNALKVTTKEVLQKSKWQHVCLTYDGSRKASGLQIYLDGQPATMERLNDSLSDTTKTDKPFHVGLRQKSLPFKGKLDDLRIVQGNVQATQVNELGQAQPLTSLVAWLGMPPESWTPEQREQAKQITLRQLDPNYVSLQQEMASKEKERTELMDQFPGVMIMKEMNPRRETFVLNRGQYDQPTEKVEPNVPEVLRSFSSLAPTTRLELAKWLVHPAHPLTARVAVNRFWENYFGIGLVKTSEDFGTTGEFPSHRELLDFLAMYFIDSGWDVRELQRLIVLSETYQQDSRITEENLAKDPENRWLARGPRYRLAAETIRDNALAIAGILQPRVGGPSVKPYQPAGLWEDVTVERRGKYVPDQGEGLYRRSMYTFWKRTCPPPAMVSFDAPNREVCVARRSRTNTPLQSLVLMNDPTYVEAARALGETMLASQAKDEARIQEGYLRAVSRSPRTDEVVLLLDLLAAARDRFQKDQAAAEQLTQVGSRPRMPDADVKEIAAWTIVASTILNLDETISKR